MPLVARGEPYARRVQVRETNLKQLVQGEKQFRVPLWQRQYTWRIADHRLLWRDIMEQYTRAADGAAPSQSGHFLGSIVLSPVPSAASGVASYLIVDGQQRLTTLMLILSAIRDAAAKTDERAIERYDELYLINKFQQRRGVSGSFRRRQTGHRFSHASREAPVRAARIRSARHTGSSGAMSSCSGPMRKRSTSTG